jgi:ElaB/YqjD/DUF883 family membrane-anchored ribosome-binding protein
MNNQNENKEALPEIKEIIDHIEEICLEKGVELKNVATELYQDFKKTEEAAVGKIKGAACYVNESTHSNPWPYIGGAAAFGIILGLLIPIRR